MLDILFLISRVSIIFNLNNYFYHDLDIQFYDDFKEVIYN